MSYVIWSCDCADFVETKNHKGDDFIFIEAADPSLIVPEEFYASGHFTRAYSRKQKKAVVFWNCC